MHGCKVASFDQSFIKMKKKINAKNLEKMRNSAKLFWKDIETISISITFKLKDS